MPLTKGGEEEQDDWRKGVNVGKGFGETGSRVKTERKKREVKGLSRERGG